ncbi:MAG: L,D-transpeptidase family protein [Gammaproteobacteria bacterium]|jgi:murein L,D-transpeptidase YafK|nr:L,D-transpeptidase family protein [Gammaproteobacteria bacterium]
MSRSCYRSLAVLIAAIAVIAVAAEADDKLPASLIRMPESVTTVFVAETSTALFHRFDRSGDNIVQNGSYNMSIGKNGPGKQRSGDRRTPLGVYFVTEQLDTSRLHDKYGVTAFPLDYPNEWDRLSERDGDGIWLHGVLRNGGRRPERDTDGCIALPNADLTLLAPEFRDNVTPVLVTTTVSWIDEGQNSALRLELENRIAEWTNSQRKGDLHAYLSLYSETFQRWEMNKAEWSSLVLQTPGRHRRRNIDSSNLLLVAYPEEDGVYFSRFRLAVVENEREITRQKRLYWRREANGALMIVAEDDG